MALINAVSIVGIANKPFIGYYTNKWAKQILNGLLCWLFNNNQVWSLPTPGIGSIQNKCVFSAYLGLKLQKQVSRLENLSQPAYLDAKID